MMTATTAPALDPSYERQQRKKLAARVRQQRCRARKREAKMVSKGPPASAGLMKDVRRQSPPIVRGPVLIHHRSPVTMQHTQAAPMMNIPMLHHHPTSPFVLYPRRAPASFPSSPPASSNYWATNLTNSPVMSAYSRNPMRPSHKEIMAQSSMGLGMCNSPRSSQMQLSPGRYLQIPRVSPVAETKMVAIPMIPNFDRLERKEETAIDAMLCLHRSASKSEDSF